MPLPSNSCSRRREVFPFVLTQREPVDLACYTPYHVVGESPKIASFVTAGSHTTCTSESGRSNIHLLAELQGLDVQIGHSPYYTSKTMGLGFRSRFYSEYSL